MQEFNAGRGCQFQLQIFLYGYYRIQNEQGHSNKYHFYQVFQKRINDVKHKERSRLTNFYPIIQLGLLYSYHYISKRHYITEIAHFGHHCRNGSSTFLSFEHALFTPYHQGPASALYCILPQPSDLMNSNTLVA